MKTWIVLLVSLAMAGTAAGGCAPGSRFSRADAGTVLGGVAGGVVGSGIGRGHGRTAGIIAGTILGAVIGQEIGRSIDVNDELAAQQALEGTHTGTTSTWVNPDTGTQVAMTPTRTYQQDDGEYCREYTTRVTVGGERQQAYGTACRQPDGSWKVVE